MPTAHSVLIVEFAKTTNNICLSIGITILLIIIFMMTPLNTFLLSSIIAKIVILILLGYTIYYSISQTQNFANKFNISVYSSDNGWSIINTNVLCSYIFSLFLLVLFISVARTFF